MIRPSHCVMRDSSSGSPAIGPCPGEESRPGAKLTPSASKLVQHRVTIRHVMRRILYGKLLNRSAASARCANASFALQRVGAPRTAAIMVFLAAFILGAAPSLAAPADDGQTAGSRTWTLNQGRSFVTVTPSDSADLAIAPTRGILTSGTSTGAACVLVARGADDGTTNITMTIAPGIAHPFQLKRILATSTTCTGIVAIY